MSIAQTLKKKIGSPTTPAMAPSGAHAVGEKDGKTPSLTEEQKKVFSAVFEKPQITEKATALHQKNQYTFVVRGDANKPQTRDAIEKLYGVTVESVRMITIPPKSRMRGQLKGWKKGYRKAIVRVKKGQSIDIK